MDINQRIKEELEGRIKKLEDFIADKGLGSTRLTKARKIQRNINIALFLGSILTVAGFTLWVLNRNHDE
jgi:hypothetical protein